MINSSLTNRKETHCEFREFHEGAGTFAGDEISASWKFSLLGLHY